MSTQIVPIPKVPLNVRDATLADVAFIDSLQKLHADRVGFMRTSWIEAKIRAGQVLVAWAPRPCSSDESESMGGAPMPREPVGYVMGVDRYFKRDDVGITHQMNVVPGSQRSFVGATLLKAMFDRAAYGCKLFCCWCAQDIEANRFWEAMGFVPLAYRAGSERNARVHIFWQKRIRAGDDATPWWFPSQTTGGALNADRLVLPIPPGKHWSDELPVLLPAPVEKQLPGPRKAKERTAPPPRRHVISRANALFFAPAAPAKPERPKREKKPKAKNDPRLIAAARELRDRWLEHVNAGEALLESQGKYDVTRILPSSPAAKLPGSPALLAA